MIKQHFSAYRTNKKIQEALLTLLQTQEFKTITVDEITQLAHVGRSTFYSHYEDKYDLFKKIVNAIAQEFDELISEHFSEDASLHFEKTLILSLNLLNTKRDQILLLLGIHVEGINLHQEYQRIIKKYVEEVIVAKKESNDLKVPIDYLYELYSNIAMTFFVWQLKNGKHDTVIDFGQHLQQCILEHM